ncbi:hypothetical protein RRG08_012341 [Elysia crispata]|uniref:Uncharacterized protein n=1 Tax=Elysia crispata TaxID=231223 RepID=A0AAE1DW50_9GAST|nr:hypothetical protein RRG08_012341 [Elysia crispata]
MQDKTAHKATPALNVKLDQPRIGAACDQTSDQHSQESGQYRTLEEKAAFIAQKEQGKATKTAVDDSSGAMSHPHQRPLFILNYQASSLTLKAVMLDAGQENKN